MEQFDTYVLAMTGIVCCALLSYIAGLWLAGDLILHFYAKRALLAYDAAIWLERQEVLLVQGKSQIYAFKLASNGHWTYSDGIVCGKQTSDKLNQILDKIAFQND